MEPPASRVRMRPELALPGLDRVHDYQRVISYGVGALAGFAIDLGTFRSLALGFGCLILAISALYRLARPARRNVFKIGLSDILLAPILVAFATGDLVYPIATALLLLVVLSLFFQMSREIVISLGSVSVGIATIAGYLVRDLGPPVNGLMLVLTISTILLAIALFILAFFGMHSGRLRSSLSRRETELASVLETAPVTIMTIDRDGRIAAISGERSGLFGVEGSSSLDSMHPELRRLLKSKGRTTTSQVDVAGRTYQVMCTGDKEGTTITAFDVTDLELARRGLEAQVQSKNQFLAAISHELRTPLTAVLGFAEELKTIPCPDEETALIHGLIADQANEMASIIEDLLVAARADMGMISVTAEPLDLASVGVLVHDGLLSRMTHNVELEARPAMAIGDPLRVRQIIRNLLTNADRYGGDHIIMRTGSDGEASWLEVLDNGKAIPLHLRERIFEPYESSGQVRGQPAAIGLGLSVSRLLAELMSGRISYRHADGWCAFRLDLKAAPIPHDVRSQS